MRKRNKEKGSLLLTGLVILVVLSLVGWAFIYFTINLSEEAQHMGLSKQAYYAADAGIERASTKLWENFRSLGMAPNFITVFGERVDEWEEDYIAGEFYVEDSIFNDKCEYQVFIKRIPELCSDRQVVVEINSTGKSWFNRAETKYIERTIVAQVRYYLGGSQLMDFAYFANNFAWHEGGIRNGGSMGSNGWLRLQSGPYIAGGDRYRSCEEGGGSLDIINKIDDGGLYAKRGFKTISISGYNDIWPRNIGVRDRHQGDPNAVTGSGSKFDGIEMPSLASAEFYEDAVLTLEKKALEDEENYGIYMWVAGGTQLYNKDGTSVVKTIEADGEYIQICDAVYGDYDPGVEEDSTNCYYYQNGKWKNGEKDSIIIKDTDSTHPLQVYGTVVVRENVILGNNNIDGTGGIYAGNNIYVAGNITYKNQPQVTPSGGVSTTMTGYRGFTGINDADNDPNTGCTRTLAQAEANQESWLNANRPESPDVSNATDLLGLFANESICIGNVGNSDTRSYLEDYLTWSGSITVGTNKSGSTTTNESVNLNESDEAKLGPDQVPNTRTSKYQESSQYVDKEYGYETNNFWDVKFYTTDNPPPANAVIPGTGELIVPLDPNDLPTGEYKDWASKYKNAVIPGSGEDIDGDGVYDDVIDIYDVAALSASDASAIRNGTKDWNLALTLNTADWGGNVDVAHSDNRTMNQVCYNTASNVTRLDAITYTNHVWGGYVKGPTNGTLITRLESTRVSSGEGCPVNHDDRVVAGGESIRSSNLIVPQQKYMEVISWKE